jgi:small subunit ribosomal protein S4
VNFPSYRVRKGDVVKIKPQSLKKNVFQSLSLKLKKQKTPSWLMIDVKNLEGKITGAPSFEEAAPPVEISAIFEHYSR